MSISPQFVDKDEIMASLSTYKETLLDFYSDASFATGECKNTFDTDMSSVLSLNSRCDEKEINFLGFSGRMCVVHCNRVLLVATFSVPRL